MMSIFRILLFTLLISSCKLTVRVNQVLNRAPIAPNASFVILVPDDSSDLGERQYLGDLKIQDAGLTLNCEYEEVIEIAEKRARSMGGNVLKIEQHKLPTIWGSNCHRIAGKVFWVQDITLLEKQVYWDENRPLTFNDFKGSTVDRPYQSSCMSYFTYLYYGRVYQGKVKMRIKTIFDCERSYFKRYADDQISLTTWQAHFDLTELYARKFTKKVSEQIKKIVSQDKELQDIYQKTARELEYEKDKYTTETDSDPLKQSFRALQIKKELAEYAVYASKIVEIPFF